MSELRKKIFAGLSFGTPSVKITTEIMNEFCALESRLEKAETVCKAADILANKTHAAYMAGSQAHSDVENALIAWHKEESDET